MKYEICKKQEPRNWHGIPFYIGEGRAGNGINEFLGFLRLPHFPKSHFHHSIIHASPIKKLGIWSHLEHLLYDCTTSHQWQLMIIPSSRATITSSLMNKRSWGGWGGGVAVMWG